jgi:PAS domain S-box-containing protein/putative nucleotidyltransferase with HDIG domain
MLWQWSLSVIAELIASAAMLVLAVYSPWRELNRQARLTGVTLVFFCALWILSHAIEIAFPVASYKESLVGIQLILGMMALTFWLFYIFHYLVPKILLTWRIYILFGIMPLVAILALSTNTIYGLMWTEIGFDSANPYLPLQPTYGIIYWACMVYIAILTLTGSFLILWNIVKRRNGYRRESIYMLIAAVIPLITAFIEVMGLLSFLKLSVGLSSWTACIGAIILILNLPRFHLEQVIPVARDITFERIGDCILVLDKQNRVLDLNPAAEQLTGYKISGAFGLSIDQIWPYQSSSMIPMAKENEELVLERDGKQRTYDLRTSTITDPGGHLTSKVVLLSDITERKLSEKALRESEQQYRILFQSASEGIGIVQDGMFKLVNPQLVQLLGYTQEEILSTPITEFIHPENRELVMQRYLKRLKGEIFENVYQFRAVNKSGDARWVVISTVLIEWEGRPATLDYYTDVTESKLSEEKLLKSYASLKKTLNDAIDTMVKIVETRDPYTSGHQQKVADLATAIAREMKLEETRVDNLRMAAVIHDIGKMYIPSDILSKPGKLSDIEFSLIKTHSQYGYDIVKGMDFPCNVAKVVLQHHERLDGSGYPNQLKGDDTILEAKILVVADVMEAMVADRPYRPALGVDKAIEEISKNKGRLYDPAVVDACLALFNSGRFEFKPV